MSDIAILDKGELAQRQPEYTEELPDQAYDPNDFLDQGGIGFEPK